MAILSRKTLGIASRMITEEWTDTVITHFFYENDVPHECVVGANKLRKTLNVFLHYENMDDFEKLRTLVESALPRLSEQARGELESALLRDGFGTVDGKLLDAEPDAQANRSALEVLLDQYPNDLDLTTLRHHLRESIDLFRQEKWDSSISHCRNLVEQLLKDIARQYALARAATPDLSKPVKIRDYLQNVGFFDEAERKKLVDGVYGYFSEEGSHPGISTQSAARICNSILASFGLYVLEKYRAWKLAGGR